MPIINQLPHAGGGVSDSYIWANYDSYQHQNDGIYTQSLTINGKGLYVLHISNSYDASAQNITGTGITVKYVHRVNGTIAYILFEQTGAATSATYTQYCSKTGKAKYVYRTLMQIA